MAKTQASQPAEAVMSSDSVDGVAQDLGAHIAAELKEPNVELIQSIVEQAGEKEARAMLAETQQIQAAGGQLIASGKRPRTPGGVFINLARQKLSKQQKQIVFGDPTWRHVWIGPGTPPEGIHPDKRPKIVKPEPWDVVRNVVKKLLKAKEIGKATEVKIQLTGRPGKVAVRKHFVVTTIETHAEPPELQPGMPTPPKARLMYLVYLPRKAWGPISHYLRQHPTDEVIVDGFLTYDATLKKLSVFATKATTRVTEEHAAARVQAAAEAQNEAEDEMAEAVESET